MSFLSSVVKGFKSVIKPVAKVLGKAAPILSVIPGAGLVGGAAKVLGGLGSAAGAVASTALKYPISTGLAVGGAGLLAGGGSAPPAPTSALAPLAPIATGGGGALGGVPASMSGALQSPFRGYKAHYDAMGNIYYTRRHRRMNPLNPKAARRAIRRIKGARKMLQHIERQLPHRKATTYARRRR